MTLPAYADSWTNGLNAIQMSSSPGLLSGDRIDIQITLAESTALSLKRSPRKSASVSLYFWIIVPMAPSKIKIR